MGEFHIRKITVLGMHKVKMLDMCRYSIQNIITVIIIITVISVHSNNLIKT